MFYIHFLKPFSNLRKLFQDFSFFGLCGSYFKTQNLGFLGFLFFFEEFLWGDVTNVLHSFLSPFQI